MTAVILAWLAALTAALIPAAGAAEAPNAARELFDMHCGICHQPHGAGTIALAHRLGPEHSLLADRQDLDAAYIKQVVRNGIGSMPPQTRVDLTDAELAAVAAYLTRPASERQQDAAHE